MVGRAEVAGVGRVREDGEPREALSVARDAETQNRQSFVPEREQRDERVVWILRGCVAVGCSLGEAQALRTGLVEPEKDPPC